MIRKIEVNGEYLSFLSLSEFKAELEVEFEGFNCLEFVDLLIVKAFIIVVKYQMQEYIHINDVKLCRRLIKLNLDDFEDYFLKNDIWAIKKIKVRNDTSIYFENKYWDKRLPSFARNILLGNWDIDEHDEQMENNTRNFQLLGCIIETTNPLIASYIQNAIYRKYALDKRFTNTNFAKSGSYMGTKRKILGFIVEAMYLNITENSVFLDLMCGSGVVSNALSLFGEVYASDALKFCQLLAVIQGAGFSLDRAKRVLSRLHYYYKENLMKLQSDYYELYKEESDIFYINQAQDNTESLFNRYIEFTKKTHIFSDTYPNSSEIEKQILQRRENNKLFPYCLFTLYYSNVFFGLEQCMELDSIRYAIDKIDTEIYDADGGEDIERNWALGCLIVTVSAVSSVYGGHYAQPLVITTKNIINTINIRQKSVWLEFSAVFLEWSKLSEIKNEEVLFPIHPLNGPWQNALLEIKKKHFDNLIVYLDAPYKRETYSRFYHVYETMALYDYPKSENKGRLRSLKERSKTEFSTRSIKKVEETFERIICEILKLGATCVWSYSNNATGSIPSITDSVYKKTNCDVFLYATDYKYAKQGKRTKNREENKIPSLEYIVIFKP